MSESKTNPSQTKARPANVEHYEPLLLRGFRADFSRDVRIDPPVYHVIITREGEHEILGWSQANTLDGARAHAVKYIENSAGQTADSAEAAG